MANEKLLIDANAFLSSMIKRFKCVPLIGRNDYDCESLRQMLIEAPTVDAVEVVHGEWEIIEDDYFDLVELKCSVCGVSYGFEDYEDDTPKNYHYCPNCGSKMDGGNYETDSCTV